MHRHSGHQDAIDQAFDQLLTEAMNECVRKQALFQQRIAAFSRWDLNEAGDVLTLSAQGGGALSVRVVPAGTYMPEAAQWAWAWANEGFPQALREAAARIKGLSAKTGYEIFEVPAFKVSAQDIDQLCALALHELQGAGIFKIKDQAPWCFYVVEA